MSWFLGIKDIRQWLSQKGIGSYSNYQIGQRNAVYIKGNNYAEFYNTIPELQIVVSKVISMALNGVPKLYRNGEYVESHPFYNLIAMPNALQTKDDFLAQAFLNYLTYGNSFTSPLRVSKSLPKHVWNLPSDNMKVVPTGKMFKQTKKKDIIKYYELETAGAPIKFKPEEITHIKNSSNSDYLSGISVVESLKRPLSNILISYDARNVIQGNKGAIGAISYEQSKDDVGNLPMMNATNEISEQYLKKFGTEQGKTSVIVSKKPFKWVPFSYPLKDLMLHEEVAENFMKICDAYGLSVDIFSTSKGSTFDNKEKAMIGAYQDTIIPLASKFMNAFAMDWGLTQEGYEIKMDYSHINILQDDEASKITTRATEVSTIISILDRGLITEDEAREKIQALYENF